MNVSDLVRVMEGLAPCRWAASWDNVGLLVGDPAASVERVTVVVDCTRDIVCEAAAPGSGAAIVSYHPVVFAPQKRFVAGSVAFEAARAGVAVYSPHTALDAAPGGTNDWLADVVGMRDRAPLRRLAGADGSLKLVTFVPEEHIEAVSGALFAAGAGRIGQYSACSFRSPGTGTFFGEAGAHPVVGEGGRFEFAPEVRLEVVTPVARAGAVVRALRSAHPYEEPAFDLVRLAAPPGDLGFGRVGEVEPATASAYVDRIKRELSVEGVLAGGPPDRQVRRVAVCAGSAGDLVDDALASGADLIVTGELRHHDALRVVSRGVALACLRHSTSERGALAALAKRLEEQLPGMAVTRSALDVDPFVFA